MTIEIHSRGVNSTMNKIQKYFVFPRPASCFDRGEFNQQNQQQIGEIFNEKVVATNTFSPIKSQEQGISLCICLSEVQGNNTKRQLKSYQYISRPSQSTIIMSKSVKSYQSTSRKNHNPKELQNIDIKHRIKQILFTVKDERQHIENLLHEHDIQIHSLRQQYENMRYQHDFDHLSAEEEVILGQIAEGLEELSIEPTQVLGQGAYLKGEETSNMKKLTKEEIIRVQQVLLGRLQAQLLEQ